MNKKTIVSALSSALVIALVIIIFLTPTSKNYVKHNGNSLCFETSCVFDKYTYWEYSIEDESIVQYDDGSSSGEVYDDESIFKRQIRHTTESFKPISAGTTKITFTLSSFAFGKTKYVYYVTVTETESGELIARVS